ncbi:LysR substrate-binding domain-containing protein [Craurococcus roseus]|uniref:LysR substrate-binding domain-containing protein n=1 Tax=Craurococcus roseus TaxID=77585 RepID=A0ABN1FY64_9PROT
MPLHLPLSALRAFEAAARTGSFRAAAEDLGLTPSAVSHAVRSLEDSLGSALFLREGRSIRLTPDGETLVGHVERAFGELRLGIGAVSARGPQLLRLHSAPTFAANWLAPRLRRMLQDCAGLEVRISAGVDYTRFVADEFDADIVYGLPSPELQSGPPQRGVVVLPLGTEVVTPLCAPELAAGIRSPHDLLRHTLIESDNKRVRWPAWFAANGLPAPEPRGPRFDRSFLSLSAAADGLGVALESLLLAERELAAGRLARPLEGACEDVFYTGHWLVFPRAKQHLRPLVAFRKWIAAELGIPTEPAQAGPQPFEPVSRIHG